MTAVVTLAVLAALSAGAARLVLLKPQLDTKGQGAAGQGMYSAFVAILLMLVAAGLGILALVLALDRWT